MSFHGVGHWQTIVTWLEIDPNDEEGLIQCEGVFTSEEERDAFLRGRIETGLVYDLIGVIESSWVTVENPLPRRAETPENGFARVKKNKPP